MSNSLPIRKIGLALLLLLIMCPIVYSFMSEENISSIQRLSDAIRERTGISEFPEEYAQPVLIKYHLRSYINQETEIKPKFREGSELIILYAYDIESDGIIEYKTKSSLAIKHEFTSPGIHPVTIYAIDNLGGYGECQIIIEILPGSGTQEIIPSHKPLSYNGKREKRSHKTALTDDSVTYALLYAQTDAGIGYFNNIAFTHKILDSVYGIDPANIYFISNDLGNQNPADWDDTLLVDLWVTYNYHALDSAANFLYSRMGSDDNLIIFNASHGSGFFDSAVYTYGDASGPYASIDAAPYRFLGGWEVLSSGDYDIEFTEETAPVTYFWSKDMIARSFGLYEWAPCYQNMDQNYRIYRKKAVAQFDSMPFYVFDTNGVLIEDSIEIKADNDIWIEEVNQICFGDTNHDGYIQASIGETADWDEDGNLPVDTNTNGEIVFDEDDWDTIYYWLNTDYEYGYLFDSTFDSIADFTYPPDYDAPEVKSSDDDNDGIIAGIDWNGDNDLNDSVGYHENDCGLFGIDTMLSNFLDSLDYHWVQVILGNCFSGGYIENGGRPNVLIATAAPKGTVAWNGLFTGGGFVHYFTDAMSEDSAYTDVDSNGCLSFLEAFNRANSLSGIRGLRAWYDDNGDRIASYGTLPNWYDGWLGSELSWSQPCDSCMADCVGGDANHSCQVDISDLTYLINYLYYGGSEPIPVKSGDVTGTECVVDISDIVRVMQWLQGLDTTTMVCGCAE